MCSIPLEYICAGTSDLSCTNGHCCCITILSSLHSSEVQLYR